MGYDFIIKGKWGRGKDHLIQEDVRLTSLAPPLYQSGECLTLWGQLGLPLLLDSSLVAQMLKSLPTMRKTRVRSLGPEDPWRRKWQPTPVFLPWKSHGQRSLVGHSPWGRKESDTTEQLHFFFRIIIGLIQISRRVVTFFSPLLGLLRLPV